MIITIDGPTASGKSTLARKLAEQLGYYYIYSGLMFRALAYLLHTKCGYTIEQSAHPRKADIDAMIDSRRFFYSYDVKLKERIVFDDVDITQELKKGAIDQYASIISQDAYVRETLLNLQRSIAQSHDVVVDGRDAGSVVFPHADYKFYLTATEDERARRWISQQAKYGIHHSFQKALSFVHKRDERDTRRNHAPLTISQGAHIIDNTGKTVQETFEIIRSIIGT